MHDFPQFIDLSSPKTASNPIIRNDGVTGSNPVSGTILLT